MKYEDLSFTMTNKDGIEMICDILAVVPNPEDKESPYVIYTDYTLDEDIILDQNDVVAFRNSTNYFSKDTSNYYQFAMTGSIEANGNLQSLMNFSDSCTSACYFKLFSNCTSLVKAP